MASRLTANQFERLVENPGVPIRNPSTALLTIDTRDRVKYDLATGYRIDTTSPNQVYINKQQSLLNGFFTRLALTEINMQWNIPNVIESGPCKNNTLLLEAGAAGTTTPVTASYTLELAQGFYTPRELADAVELALNTDNALGSTAWVCTWSERTNAFELSPDGGAGAAFFRVRPQNANAQDDLCNLMGFSYPPQQFSNILEGSFASMQYTPYVDIVSQNITKKQNVNDNSSSTVTGQNLLARVYIAQDGVTVVRDRTVPASPQEADCSLVGVRPFNLYRKYDAPKQIFWDTDEFINVVDLRLVDYKGRTLYNPNETAYSSGTFVGFCGNATNYQLTLQVTEQ